MSDLHEFVANWKDDENNVKPLFLASSDYLHSLPNTTLSFKGRPGISYSLRAKHANQTTRDLFVLVDVIDDDPAARWLSICFYADLITDTMAMGDTVPAGLMGEDAHCFDVEDPTAQEYLLAKLLEAYTNAAK